MTKEFPIRINFSQEVATYKNKNVCSEVVHERIQDDYGWVCETCEKLNIAESTAHEHKRKGHEVNYRLFERTIERKILRFPKSDGG